MVCDGPRLPRSATGCATRGANGYLGLPKAAAGPDGKGRLRGEERTNAQVAGKAGNAMTLRPAPFPTASRGAPATRLRVALVLSVATLAACDSLTLRREPETARIEIESSDVDQVNLITADWFLFVDDPDCPGCESAVRLVDSDTSLVALPFEQTYRFGPRLQFFAETYPAVREPAVLSLRAYVDGAEWINSSRLLQPADDNGRPETLRFVYQYSLPRLP